MDQEWLNLSDAADLLGVHPATVRAWGDKGELPMQRTAGGHRRFRRADVEARAALNQSETTTQTGANILIQNLAGRTRLELLSGHLSLESWYQQLDEAAKQQHGEIGRRFLRLATRTIGQANDEEMLAEAREIGRAYERLGREHGLSLTQTTRAYLHFREFLSATIYDMAHATGPQSATDWRSLREQVITLTNEILLAIIAANEEQIS